MKKMTIAMIAPVLALKAKPVTKTAKVKPVKPAKAAPVKPVKAKAKGEQNTDALEAPHAVKGKPHHYQYK